MTELLLQKQPGRFEVYRRRPGLWPLPGRKRWMVTDPDLIREVMTNDAFVVPTYDVSQLTARLNIDIAYLDELPKWLPLAHEGERHRHLRASFARAITSRSEPALAALRKALEARRHLFSQPDGTTVCLFDSLFRPAMRQAVGRLADIDLPPDLAVETIPQLFDDTISLARRRKINGLLEGLSRAIPETLGKEECYTRMSIVALSANTLLGSICLSFIERLRHSPGQPLAAIDWGRDLQRTALPLVEKRVVKPVTLGGQALVPGDRMRLLIEAAGFTPEGAHCYDDLFFAVGAHKCVGMNFSLKAWQAVADFLATLERRIEIVDVSERDGDYVFNIPERIVVKLDA